MATLAITFPINTEAGAKLRRLANQIEKTAQIIGENPSGASTVLTFDNAPSNGVVSVQLTAGPVTQASALIV
jgi:hypothetical protein